MTVTTTLRTWLVGSALAAILAVGGCSDSSSDTPDAQPSFDAGFSCDPVGANPEMGALFNTPLASDVEVIDKMPQHPGDPGPHLLP